MNITNNVRTLVINSSRTGHSYKRNKSTSGLHYCTESVKKYDYENFLCTLLLKSPSRDSALAIRSFNIELSKVAQSITQMHMGLMRLKFWEETVGKCFSGDVNKIPDHPVAIELFKTVNRGKLTKRYLTNLVNCRVDNLQRKSFQSLDEMEKYADQAVSNVYLLLMEINGVRNVHADHAASHLGKAQGIVQLLRSVPIAGKVKFVGIPNDILTKHNVSQENIYRQKKSDELNECSFEVASRAHQHLEKARNLLENVPKEARRVLLPAAAVDNYLTRLQKVHHDVLHPSLQRTDWLWLPKLYFKSIKNEY